MNTVRIQGMKCQHCAASVQKVLESLGAQGVQIDLLKGEASFKGTVEPEALRVAIAAKGFALVE